MRSLALAFPPERRNDWWRTHHPDLVARAAEATLARVWSDEAGNPETAAFDAAMRPYLDDPFRGTVARRVCGPEDTSLSLELRAGRRAIEAAELGPRDVDLCLVASLRSEGIGVGNAAYVVRELGLRCPAWNIESACSGSVVAFHTAASLIAAGAYRRVLVLVSCTYARDVDMSDSFSWFLGDGAAAFVVERREGEGRVRGFATIPTDCTCGTFAYHLVDGSPARIEIRADKSAGPMLRRTSGQFLRAAVDKALDVAAMGRDEIDFFVFNTPTAWYADFCTRELGVANESTVSTYPQYANIGPVLMPANLYTAAREGRISDGDHLLAYSVGSVSTASAIVFDWQGVGLHPDSD